jgi:hypothetical protein
MMVLRMEKIGSWIGLAAEIGMVITAVVGVVILVWG